MGCYYETYEEEPFAVASCMSYVYIIFEENLIIVQA